MSKVSMGVMLFRLSGPHLQEYLKRYRIVPVVASSAAGFE